MDVQTKRLGRPPLCIEELGLEQLLADPLVRMVMSSDAVDEQQIRQLAARADARRQAARRLAQGHLSEGVH